MTWLTYLTLGLVSLAATPQAPTSADPNELPGRAPTAGQIDLHGYRAPRPALATAEAVPFGGGTSSDPWQTVGLFGGDAEDVAVSLSNPQIVLAGTASANYLRGTLFRSTDGGAHWSPVSPLGSLSIYDIEPAAGDTFYVGTADGVWKSTDNGASWSQLDLGLGPFIPAHTVAVDPATPSTVWVGLDSFLGTQPSNIRRSLDGGISWTDFTPPLAEPTTCQSIAIHPSDSQKVYAAFAGGFGGGQAWVSSDAGASWTNRSAGLPNSPIATIAHDGSRLLVAGGHPLGNQTFGLYASVDEGANWTPLHDGTWPVLFVGDFAVDPNDSDKILVASLGAGVFTSTNGGTSWTIGASGTTGVSGLSVGFAPASSNQVFLGASSRAILRSTDGGSTFFASADGISELDLTSLAADPNDPNRLAATFQGLNDGGVYTSVDGGTTWQLETSPPTRYSRARFAPNGTLYAVSTGPSSVAPEGIYRREANGSWTSLGPDQGPLFETELKDLVFSPNQPAVLFAYGTDSGVAGSEATIWRTGNGGLTWQKVHEGFTAFARVTDLEIFSGGSNMVATYIEEFADPPSASGVLRSTDGGIFWFDSPAGLPASPNPLALCQTSATPSRLVLSDSGTNAGHVAIYTSSDGGQSWVSTGFTLPRAGDLACDPTDPQLLYLATSSGTPLWRSQDGGLSFLPFDGGLDSVGRPIDLTFAGPPESPRLLLASSRGGFSYQDPGSIFSDGFESGDLTFWDGSLP